MSTSRESALALDRSIAEHINPLIGHNAQESLERCSGFTSDIGYILSAAGSTGVDMDIDQLFRVFETITFALRYEAHQLDQLKGVSHE